MKTTSIRNRPLKAIVGKALAVAASTPALARAADLPNGADNSYRSDKVTVQKVTFQNQYKMKVAGNLFVPKGLKPDIKTPALIVGQQVTQDRVRQLCSRSVKSFQHS